MTQNASRAALIPTLRAILLVAFFLRADSSARAAVKPNCLFSENAVLQQGVRLPVWGTASDGEKITVTFQNQTVTTIARDGRWMAYLNPLKAGGPFVLTINGENSVVLTNVLVGEVWLCSGQSNMEMPLAATTNASQSIALAGDPQLRVFTIPHGTADEPRTELPGNCDWKLSTPGAAKYFSAVAYFFGHDLRKALKVPVGLIHSSVGGTPAEAWTARAALEADPDLKPLAAKGSGLYNAMIAPLQPYALAGVIWYQGEQNNKRASEYRELFPALIRNWRDAWGQGDFPFLFVQIAPHRDMTPEIREAQFLTWQKVPRTAMVVTTDVGEANNIHPTRKEPVGARLALAARAIAYGEKLEYSGPVYDSMKLKGNVAILSFTHIGGGLVAEGGELKGFSLAGQDGDFMDATAKINGHKVIVSSPAVAKPLAVRYGWSNVPEGNLFNREGLPATPFRTDVK